MSSIAFGNPVAGSQLAFVFKGSGRLSDSESAFRRALEYFVRHPGFAELDLGFCLNNFARLHEKMQRYDQADFSIPGHACHQAIRAFSQRREH